ncbi:hypothetical protein ACFX15_042570 [Malus domestica]
MVMQKSKDSQQRAVKMMGVICDGYENCKSTDNSELFFDHCHQIMGNRWERLRKVVEQSEVFSLPNYPKKMLCGEAKFDTRYLNASNRDLLPPNEAQLSSDAPNPPPSDEKPVRQLL